MSDGSSPTRAGPLTAVRVAALRRTGPVRLVAAGLVLLAVAGVWWTVYYAKAATATRSYKEGLAPLAVCLAVTTPTCADLDTGNEYPSRSAFFEDDDATWAEYATELLSPNGIARYSVAPFWWAVTMMVAGIAWGVVRRDVHLATYLDDPVFVAVVFVLPSLVGFLTFFLYPAVGALQIAFHEWNLLRAPKWVGLENFQDLFSDRRFVRSLRVTLAYVLWNIPLQTALALGLAVILDRTSNWLANALRTLMVLPWLLPPVVVGLLWLWILDPLLGVANVLLGFVGIDRQPFLGSPAQVIPTIAGINIWQYTGYTAVLFFAGLKTIPREIYQAAAIDGANAWAQFVRITIPLLRPVTVFVLVTSVIGSFQVFDTIAITNDGGPAGASRVILYYIYDRIFNRGFEMGTAAAASVVLFSILIVVSVVQLRFARAGESDLADYG